MNKAYTLIGFALLLISGVFLLLPSGTRAYPDYAYTDALSLSGYKFASEHPDTMSMIDCYCGCYEHSGHKSLLDCFKSSHASYCDLCKALAQKTQEGTNEGKTTIEINTELKEYYT